jgi:hypothetical protein
MGRTECDRYVPAEFARKLERERDEARELHRNALREREATEKEVYAVLERAQKSERERDEARQQYDDLATEHVLAVNKLAEERDQALMDRANGDMATMTINHYERLIKERDEARQRASDLALGVKVADCMYDYGKYSVALREAKIKARYLQELTRAAYDEVEKLEDQEATK